MTKKDLKRNLYNVCGIADNKGELNIYIMEKLQSNIYVKKYIFTCRNILND